MLTDTTILEGIINPKASDFTAFLARGLRFGREVCRFMLNIQVVPDVTHFPEDSETGKELGVVRSQGPLLRVLGS